ncbi:MAG: hypothetical protein KDD66_11555 [Bdellovibrionales bacterium]|nr:hypothetical protein [Bdellovibrionales bacterium]
MAEKKSANESPSMRREQVLKTAREHIVAAAALLRPLSSEFERVSWILEDTLMYVDEAQAAYEEENSSQRGPHANSSLSDETSGEKTKEVNAGQ